MNRHAASPISAATIRGVTLSAVSVAKLLKAKKALQGSGDARAS